MRREFRNANIGIAACAVVLVIGAILFHESDGAMEALGGVGLAVALGVCFVLNWRDEKAGRLR